VLFAGPIVLKIVGRDRPTISKQLFARPIVLQIVGHDRPTISGGLWGDQKQCGAPNVTITLRTRW
jgi:hypothetical protein